MTEFERGFIEELQKIAAYGGTGGGQATSLKGPKAFMETKPVAEQKSLATAIRNPLSLATNIKPPDQTFYEGM